MTITRTTAVNTNGTYYTRDTVIKSLHEMARLIFTTNLCGKDCHPPCHTYGQTETERLNNLPHITLVVRVGDLVGTYAITV